MLLQSPSMDWIQWLSSPSGCCSRVPRAGWLTHSKHLFLTLWRQGHLRSRHQQTQCLVWSYFLALSVPDVVNGTRELSGVPCEDTNLIQGLRVHDPVSSQRPTSACHHMGARSHHVRFEGCKHLVVSSDRPCCDIGWVLIASSIEKLLQMSVDKEVKCKGKITTGNSGDPGEGCTSCLLYTSDAADEDSPV